MCARARGAGLTATTTITVLSPNNTLAVLVPQPCEPWMLGPIILVGMGFVCYLVVRYTLHRSRWVPIQHGRVKSSVMHKREFPKHP